MALGDGHQFDPLGRTVGEDLGVEPGGFDGTFEMYQSLLHPEERTAVLAKVQAAVAAKSDYDVEHRVVWPDGSVHWLQGRGSVTLDDEGNVTGTVGCVADITERVLQIGQAGRIDGVGTGVACPVGVNRPLAPSIPNATIVSDAWFAA